MERERERGEGGSWWWWRDKMDRKGWRRNGRENVCVWGWEKVVENNVEIRLEQHGAI